MNARQSVGMDTIQDEAIICMSTVIRIGSKSGREQLARGGKYGTEVILAIMAVEGNRWHRRS